MRGSILDSEHIKENILVSLRNVLIFSPVNNCFTRNQIPIKSDKNYFWSF